MSKEDNTVRKTIGFNMDDPDESADLEHAMKRKNFSRYVKQLIHLDRVQGRGRQAAEPIQSIVTITPTPEAQTSSDKTVGQQQEVINKSFVGFL